MSYTFTIGATGATVDIPVNLDLTGYTSLKIALDKGGSAVPVEVTSGLVAGTKKVTLTIPAANVSTFANTAYSLQGTPSGGSNREIQSGVIRLSVPSDSGGQNVTLSGPIDTNPHVNGDLIKTVQNKIRHEFTGSAVDPNFWTVTTGPGMTVAVTASELRIDSGTTINSTTTLRSKQSFSGAYRVMFMSAATFLSQRIANQEFELRVTNAAGTSYASWLFNGTTVNNGILRAFNNGTSATDQVQSSLATTTGLIALEIENFIDEVYFHSRAPESTNGRATTNVKNRQTPDPTEDMFIEIVVRNLATAPATSTRLSLDAVLVQDISELTTEITGGRGGGGASQAIPVAITGTPVVNTNGNSITPNVIFAAADPATSTNLLASATFTQTGVDNGVATAQRATSVRVVVLHTAAQTPGTLYFEESTDNATWRTTGQVPVPSDALYHTFSFSSHLRYYRTRFVNGGTAQTAFFLSVESLRGEALADVSKNLNFILTPPAGQALAASATYTSSILDLGVNHNWNLIRIAAKSDQASAATGIQIQHSPDSTNWLSVGSEQTSNTAGSTAIAEGKVHQRYVRLVYTNGATAATTFFASLSLVSL